ncbi:DUF72 domain-containing protein [Pengzhenrongella frigida]|uniref:DUF72 domain-containing protein n=1 Tax=Pengzhenrongella frigida TaxID=1259133 RepID=A0A4Q5N7A0_9MICO|nr:DUF72 domain-containing protein [Cellulomonas sp. HLT2-17]RYV52331.1 DUF72 domain-containing protein [Cellulomonas sp. HLT2-17]
MADIRIGISGWRYAPWRGTFYPPGLPQAQELEYAARRLSSIEINGTFYALQRPESYRSWCAQTPPGFVFAVKGPRFVTHLRKLAGVDTALANFFASGVLALGDRLGPVLWQLPPTLAYDADRLASFFRLLPRTTSQAARLAGRHDERLEGRAWTETDADRPVRHAIEVRHPSYERPEFVRLVRDHDVALVVADSAGRWPRFEEVTADFVYVRLHGDAELYVSGYDDEALDRWAARLRRWNAGAGPAGRDVFVYLDNDAKVRAPFDAMNLARRVTGRE